MASGRRVADVAVQVESRPRRRLEFEKPAPAALSRRAVRALDLERSQHDSPEESQSGAAELGASAESRRRHARHRNLCLPVRSRRGGGVGVDGDRAYETPAGARGVRRRGVARGDRAIPRPRPGRENLGQVSAKSLPDPPKVIRTDDRGYWQNRGRWLEGANEYGVWFYKAAGSGIWLNAGRTHTLFHRLRPNSSLERRWRADALINHTAREVQWRRAPRRGEHFPMLGADLNLDTVQVQFRDVSWSSRRPYAELVCTAPGCMHAPAAQAPTRRSARALPSWSCGGASRTRSLAAAPPLARLGGR